jgi:plastocyanin
MRRAVRVQIPNRVAGCGAMKSYLLSAFVLASCASTKDEIQNPVPVPVPAPRAAEAPPAAPVEEPTRSDGVVELSVTTAGFEPAAVTVKKGQPVTLVITRKTDSTCAKDIVVVGQDIRRPLPLNQPVEVSFTPTKTGELKYGCAMNQMVGGVLFVE